HQGQRRLIASLQSANTRNRPHNTMVRTPYGASAHNKSPSRQAAGPHNRAVREESPRRTAHRELPAVPASQRPGSFSGEQAMEKLRLPPSSNQRRIATGGHHT